MRDQEHIVAAVDALCDLEVPIQTAIQEIALLTGTDPAVVAAAWDGERFDEYVAIP